MLVFNSAGILNSQISSIDSDAAAFLSATGITDGTISGAINTLVIAAKANGWWTLCNVIYPFVGGTATTVKYNLKDPRDLDAAYRLTFTGGWTHASTGSLPNGTTGFADTHFIPNILSVNSAHGSYYSRTSTSGATTVKAEFGGAIGFNPIMNMNVYCNDGVNNIMECAFGNFNTANGGINSFLNTNSLGYFLGTRTTSTRMDVYKAGSSIDNNTNTQSEATLPTVSMYLSAFNNNGTAVDFTDRECAFATFGAGINSTIAAQMYTDIQAFQTTLSRNV